MREKCSCGAEIRAPHLLVRLWRTEHLHEPARAEKEPEPQPEGATSHLERLDQHDYDLDRYAARKIGFVRDEISH